MALSTPQRFNKLCWLLVVESIVHNSACVWVIAEGVARNPLDWVLSMLLSVAFGCSILRIIMGQTRLNTKIKRIEPSAHADSICCLLAFFASYVFIELVALRRCAATRDPYCEAVPHTAAPSFVYLMCSTVVCILTNLCVEMVRQKSIRELLAGRFSDDQVHVTLDEARAADRIIDMSEHHD